MLSHLLSIFHRQDARRRDRSRRRRLGRHRSHYRSLQLEKLEDRTLLTSNLFLDFGDNFPAGGLGTNVLQLRNTFNAGTPGIQGPDLRYPSTSTISGTAFTDTTPLNMTGLAPLINYDYNSDANVGDVQDYLDLRDAVVSLVRSYYAPFDVAVFMAPALDNSSSANYLNGVRSTLQQGMNAAGEYDSWVFIASVLRTDTTPALSVGGDLNFNGISAGVDIDQGNSRDDSQIVFAETVLSFNQTDDTRLAYTAAHEAGHDFGLVHTTNGAGRNATGNAQIDADNQLLSQSNLVVDTAGQSNRSNYTFATRYPLVRGDGNTNQNDTRVPYDRLANNSNLGTSISRGGASYVTGTGAHDDIRLTWVPGVQGGSVSVSVQPFRESARTNAAGTTYTYTLDDVSTGIRIDSGFGSDRITIDSQIPASIIVYGMAGDDQLIVDGEPGEAAAYSPSTVTSKVGLDGRAEMSAVIFLENTTIVVEQFEQESTISLTDFDVVSVNLFDTRDTIRTTRTPDGGSFTISPDPRNSGLPFIPVTLSGVYNVLLNTRGESDEIRVFSLPAGVRLTVNGGDGNDRLHVTTRGEVSGGSVATLSDLGGDVDFRGGSGFNQLFINDQASPIRRDFQIFENRIEARPIPASEFDPIVTIWYSEVAELTVLAGVHSDLFHVNSTHPETRLSLFGLGGDDIFTVGQGNLFEDLESYLRIHAGEGNDRLTLQDQHATTHGGYVFGTVRKFDWFEATFQKQTILSVFPFPIVYQSGELNVGGIEQLDFQGSGQDDFFDVNGTLAEMTYNLFGNGGADDFRINGHTLESSINVFGGLPNAPASPGDRLRVHATSDDTGSYLPGRFPNDGRVTANGHNIDFSGLEPVYIEGFGSFGFTTPRSRDIIDIREYRDNPLPGTLVWTEISGTSGVGNTGFEVLRFRGGGLLSVNTVAADLILEPVYNWFDPTDVVTIHPDALGGNRVGRLQLIMGIGNDRLIDHTLDGSRATTVLEPIFVTPVEHRISGVAARIDLGSLRAFDADGALIHDVQHHGPGRMVLEDLQTLVTSVRAGAHITLDAAPGGRQGVQSNDSQIISEFQLTPEGKFGLTLQGNVLVSIIAILTPKPPELRGSETTDVLTIESDIAAASEALRNHRILITDFGADDTIRVRGATDGNHPVPTTFQADLRVPGFVFVELLVTPSRPLIGLVVSIPARRPSIELEGRELTADRAELIAPTAPLDGWFPNGDPRQATPVGYQIGLRGIESLVVHGPRNEGSNVAVIPGANDAVIVQSETISFGVVMPIDLEVMAVGLQKVTLNTRKALVIYPKPDFPRFEVQVNAVELLIQPVVDDIRSTLTQQIIGTFNSETGFRTIESIEVGGLSIYRTLGDGDPLRTTARATRVDTKVSGDFPESQDVTIRHVLTGCESTMSLDGARIGGVFSFDVIGAEGANNRVAISAVNAQFEGGVHLGFEGQSSGQNTIVIGETGVSFRGGSTRTVDIRGGSDTVLFEANSNMTTFGGPLVTDIRVAGGPTTVLTGAGVDLSPVELYGIIAILRQRSDARINSTIDLLREAFGRVGQHPAIGAEAARSMFLAGTGEITVSAYDGTDAGTTIQAKVLGYVSLQRLGNVHLEIPALVGTGIDPDGALHFCEVTNTNDSGPGSLREALECSYAAEGDALAVVSFAIPTSDPGFVDADAHLPGGDLDPDTFMILPVSALPTNFRGRVVINGQSQQNVTGDSNPFGPEIVLAGHLAGAGVDGLTLGSLENRIHSLNIQGFGGNGILIGGHGNTVTGSYIGTDPTGTASATVMPGIVSWWPGEDTAEDIAGDHDGTLLNGASFAPGLVGQAFQFDGVDDFVSTPHVVDYTAGVTFELWVKSTGDGGNCLLAGGGGATASRGMGLFLEPTGRPLLMGTKGTPGAPNFQIFPNINIANGTFHHLAGTWTGDTTPNGVKLYLDGVLIGSATALTAIATDATPLYLGDHPAYYLPFRGSIDEPTVHGSVLSASEIAAIFSQGSAGKQSINAANGLSGVRIVQGRDNVIGGTTEANRNVISGNSLHGVHIVGNSFPAEPTIVTDNPDQLIRRGNIVRGNFIGTTADGMGRLGNTLGGVYIDNSALNMIGGVKAGTRNVISANGTGVGIVGLSAKENRVAGNYVGLAADGAGDLGNTHGVAVVGDLGLSLGASGNLIGGSTDAERNVMSGNDLNDVFLARTLGTTVEGNFIGTDRTGKFMVATDPRGAAGVRLEDDKDSLIRNNVISGQAYGIYIGGRWVAGGTERTRIESNRIGTTANGRQALAGFTNYWGISIDGYVDSDGVTHEIHDVIIGGTEESTGNVISGSANHGIWINGPGVEGIQIQGNKIGTDKDGVDAVPNGTASPTNGAGILLTDTTGVRIGGTQAGAGNIISGNNGSGISILRGSGHWIEGNFIGTDVSGSRNLGNSGDGVRIDDSSGNTIGGAVTAARNVISANGRSGVRMQGATTTGNSVFGNTIGTDVSGRLDRGNRVMGVWIVGAPGNRIGGPEAGQGNLISGNDVNGVVIAYETATNNVVESNFVGTTRSGNEAIGNVLGVHLFEAPGNVVIDNVLSGNVIGLDISGVAATGNRVADNRIGTNHDGTTGLPNSADGVFIDDAPGNTLENNTISANGFNGVLIDGVGSFGNVLQANSIGINADGVTALGNAGHGVLVQQGAGRNLIGTDGNGVNDQLEGNLIAFNGGDGVTIVGDTSLGNTIRANSIFSNADLAIDLANDGITLNDYGDLLAVPPIPPDTDTGPNLRQNYPEISSVRKTLLGQNAGVSISGVLNSTPSTTFVIDVYRNATSVPEGRTWLGSVEVTTNRDGVARISARFSATAAEADEYLTTTATSVLSRTDGRIMGNTSEFSVPRVVSGSGGRAAAGDFTLIDGGKGVSSAESLSVGQDSRSGQIDDLFSKSELWWWSEEPSTRSIFSTRRR